LVIVEVWSSVLIGLVLLVAAGWLTSSHLRTWRTVQQHREQLEPKEFDYRRRQFRRRMQTTAMLGLLGLGILAAQLVSVLPVRPQVIVICWGVVMLLAVWLGLLAVADLVSTRYYFGRLKHDYFLEQVRLEAELRRLQRVRGDGHAAKEGDKQSGIPDQPPNDEEEPTED
jgi:hypothetical protein